MILTLWRYLWALWRPFWLFVVIMQCGDRFSLYKIVHHKEIFFGHFMSRYGIGLCRSTFEIYMSFWSPWWDLLKLSEGHDGFSYYMSLVPAWEFFFWIFRGRLDFSSSLWGFRDRFGLLEFSLDFPSSLRTFWGFFLNYSRPLLDFRVLFGRFEVSELFVVLFGFCWRFIWTFRCLSWYFRCRLTLRTISYIFFRLCRSLWNLSRSFKSSEE